MRLQAPTTLTTCGLLTLAGGLALTMPSQLPATAGTTATTSDQVRVLGSVRDFLSTHPDFGGSVSGVSGHFANNLAGTLAADNRPAFSGAGFRVDSQWRQGDGYPIPPHLYMGADTLFLGDGIVQDKDTTLDTWDSSLGPYDATTNSGPLPSIQIGWQMPELTEPSMPASTGDAYYEYTSTINADLHCNNFTTRKETVLNIANDVTILVDGFFDMGRDSVINILPGGKLTIYVHGMFRVAQRGMVNMNTMDPSKLWIYNLGTTQMEINQSSHVCGVIISPDAGLHLAQDDHFYGKFMGKSIQQDQTTGVHIDTSPWPTPCGGEYLDTPGSYGAFSSGGITSSATFDEWFHDTLGVNLSESHIITLTKNGSGVYEYLDDSFFPIDSRLYGNEGAANNNNFTYQFRVDFTHRACTDSFFSFEGNDDAWMFVDNKLAMDLGGVTPGTPQYIELDRLGLVDGQTYSIRFFYAHRTPGTAVFRIRTNAELNPDVADMTVSGGFD